MHLPMSFKASATRFSTCPGMARLIASVSWHIFFANLGQPVHGALSECRSP